MVDEVLWNILLMVVCYAYIGLIIVVSSKLDGFCMYRVKARLFLYRHGKGAHFASAVFTCLTLYAQYRAIHGKNTVI